MSRKVKYSVELKLAIVKQVLSRKQTIINISKDNHVNLSMIRHWVRFYERYGEQGLIPQSNKYSLDIKLSAIKTFLDNNLSLKEACLQFNIRSTSVLSKWLKIYQDEGILGLSIERRGINRMAFKATKKQKFTALTDHERILEENNRLRAEVAFLKKLHALIQKEEAEKRKRH